MKKYSFKTIIEKDGKQYHGFVPALAGCHTFGKTVKETKKHLAEAIEGYLISCMEHKDPIPKDTGIYSVQTVSIHSPIRKKRSHA